MLELNNFNGVLELVSALGRSPIHRLQNTWAGVSKYPCLIPRLTPIPLPPQLLSFLPNLLKGQISPNWSDYDRSFIKRKITKPFAKLFAVSIPLAFRTNSLSTLTIPIPRSFPTLYPFRYRFISCPYLILSTLTFAAFLPSLPNPFPPLFIFCALSVPLALSPIHSLLLFAFVRAGILSDHDAPRYLGMYLTDLTFIEDGHPDLTPNGLINFMKRRQIALVIREIQQFQNDAYNFKPLPQVLCPVHDAQGPVPPSNPWP